MQNSKSLSINEYQKLIELGIYQAKNREFDKSINFFLEAIKKNKTMNMAYLNLANVYVLKKKNNKAIEILEEYMESNKYDVDILSHLWKICINFNLENKLFKFLKKLELNDHKKYKNRYFIFYLIAKQYVRAEDINRAIKYYKKCIEFNKRYEEAYFELCEFLERVNKIEDLERVINLLKKNCVSSIKSKYYESLLLNRKKQYYESEKIIEVNNLEKLFIKDGNYYIKILGLLSKNNEKLENYEKALKSIDQRNLFLRNLDEYKNVAREDLSEIINHYKNVYNKEIYTKKFKKLTNLNTRKINIAFLVGFPRSGTTLLDTILLAEPNTIVLEEKPYIREARDKYFSQNNNNLYSIKEITEDEIIEIRNSYLKQLNIKDINDDKLIIDKLPLTLTELGFIKIIFPESKIIFALRHPCDVVFSCYATFFKPNQAMINFLNLNDTVKFYDAVFSLFEFYENELNLNYIKIKYENVVNNFEDEIKKLFNYLGLKFDSNIQNFYIKVKERGIISTPSYNQVSNPIYKSSIGRWKKYEKFINIEKKLQKWIKKFDY